MGRSTGTQDLTPADILLQYVYDPLAFVRDCYPWGQPGRLANETGPDRWQVDFLEHLGREVRERNFNGQTSVSPVRMCASAGRGVGKTTLIAWIVNWIMCTRPYCRGTITANTWDQLQTKTWASIREWHSLCRLAPEFVANDSRFFHKDHRDTWSCEPATCREENSESFQGQHAHNSTSFYVFDEASGIPEKIFTAAEGGLILGEPMIFLFSNPTRREGAFYDAVFGRDRSRWDSMTVDARESKMSNKALIEEWIVRGQKNGDDDFCRVYVQGIPPLASEAQFIDHKRILDAQKRHVEVDKHEPLVAGVDMAWGGSDENVIRFRCGLDGRCIPAIRIKGELTRDPQVLVNRLSDVLKATYDVRGVPKKVTRMFLDSAGIAGPVGHRLREMGFQDRVLEINFGADSPTSKCAYFRDYMWYQMKEWLLAGAIDDDPGLESDLVAPGVVTDREQRVKLESKQDIKKRRGGDSPDDGDALALTFAVHEPIEIPFDLEVSEKLALQRDPYGRTLTLTDAIIARHQIAQTLKNGRK